MCFFYLLCDLADTTVWQEGSKQLQNLFLHYYKEINIQACSKLVLLSVFHLHLTGPFTIYTYIQNYSNYHLEEVKFTEVQS